MSSEIVKSDIVDGMFAIDKVRGQVQAIQQLMASIMKDGEHYGVIPGCGKKPSLLKAGAEKLGFTFRLAPTFHVDLVDMGHGHREYRVKCILTHSPSGMIQGEGVGSGSTMESKYRWRNAGLVCPACGKEDVVIKGKAEYGGGWICFAKKGGCGAKFADNDPAIKDQHPGRVENADIADVYNTVLKMAKKRAHVDAMLTCTAASDIFTQDIEDMDIPAKASTATTPAAPEPPTAPAVPMASPEAQKAIMELVSALGWSGPHAQNWLKKHYQVGSRAQLTHEQGEAVKKELNRLIDEKEATKETTDFPGPAKAEFCGDFTKPAENAGSSVGNPYREAK